MENLEEPKDIIHEMIKQYHIAQDMKLLHDLLVEIMMKGYYPVIVAENKPPTMVETERGFMSYQPLNLELKLKTQKEVEEMGYNFVDFIINLENALKAFSQSSTPTAKKEKR